MTCFRASLNVALEWYITFLTKQWCKKHSRGGHGISGKEWLEATASLSFLISIPELVICFVGKAHVTKMKLNLNFFPLVLQNSADKLLYFLEARDFYRFNYMWC